MTNILCFLEIQLEMHQRILSSPFQSITKNALKTYLKFPLSQISNVKSDVKKI